ncbi:MAG TPA: hypothetical protein DCM64_03195 [Gammaproteobacteria bacterium]|nr:hypothetical protein [Gammaproteobacteria bacterium]|tara:strand:- start:5030 stop:6016 length:987 start_codon:yes stop_codon:yes gene_type:complete
MQRILQLLSLLVLFTSAPTVTTWDSIGHRVTAAVALQFISDEKQSLLLELLGQHPRFEEDFLDAMPDFIAQGAVSKQIKLLEQQLNMTLFARKGPYLSLTKEGEQLLATVTAGMEIINQGIATLRRQSDSTLTLTILPSFASNWLLPRLRSFESNNPELSIHLASSYANVDFALQTDIDAGIRLGTGTWPGLYSKQITADRVFPVCTPAKAASINGIADHAALIDAVPFDEWENWYAAIGQPYKLRDRKFYDDSITQIRAAMEGLGISLVREELVQEYLDSGILVRLFDVDYFSNLHYFFVCPESRKNEMPISIFCNWLIEQGSLVRE